MDKKVEIKKPNELETKKPTSEVKKPDKLETKPKNPSNLYGYIEFSQQPSSNNAIRSTQKDKNKNE